MPIGFTSAARNLFLLGSAGADLVTNFFKTIDQSSTTDGVFTARDIKYLYSEERYLLAGSALNSQGKSFGFHEKRQEDGTEDWSVKTQSTDPTNNVTLTSLELDSNGNLLVGGLANDAPWIARYTTAGVLQWTSTTNTGDGRYFGLAVDSDDNYYGAGRTKRNDPLITDDGFRSSAILEKYDNNGNTVWGKSVSVTGENVCFNKVDATSTSIIAAGYLGDGVGKGYLAKFDKSNGEMQWDRTIVSNEKTELGVQEQTSIEDIHVDPDGNIYLCGTLFLADSEDVTEENGRGFVIKYSAEGNLLWQKEVGVPGFVGYYQYYNISVDDNTRQVVVFGRTYNVFATGAGLLTKLSSSGQILWNRKLLSDRVPPSLNHFSRISGFDADPSFYYVFFTDDDTNLLNGTPDEYTFGKVSSSGNGLGDFQYEPQTGINIDYEITNPPTRIGKLQDGSIRNDSSDLTSYPFSALKISFDDYATPITNKKAILSDKDLVQRSGSPAIRVCDFQEMNLLGDVGVSDGPELVQNGTFDSDVSNWTAETSTISWNSGRLQTNRTGGSGYTSYQVIPTEIGKTYTVKANIDSTGSGGRQDIRVLSDLSTNSGSILSTSPGNGVNGSTVDVEVYFTAVGTTSYVYTVSDNTGTGFFDNISVKLEPWLDQSGKGNDGDVVGATHNAAGYWEFDGTDDFITTGVTHNPSEPFSFTFWFNLDTIKEWHNLVDMFINGTNRNFQLFVEGDGDYRIFWGNATTGSYAITSPTTVASTWYFGAFTCDGSTGTLYRYGNGTFDSVKAPTIGAGTYATRPLVLGRRGDSSANGFVDGNIGEFQFYKKELTAAQVFQNYNATKSKYINEAPDTAPKIGPGIVYGSNLKLNYDFGNRATYDRAENLIRNSTDATSFTGYQRTITNNAALAPDGTMTAAKIAFNDTSGGADAVYYLDEVTNIPANNAGTYTYSVWLRGPDGFTGGARIALLIQTGSNTEISVDLTDEWQQYSVTKTYDNTFSTNIRIHPVIFRNQPGAIDVGKLVPEFVYLWHPQLEKSSTTGRHVPTYGSMIQRPITVKNLSNSSDTGTIDGAVFNTDGYFEFDGQDDYISAGNLGSFYTQGTINFWINSTAVVNYKNPFHTHYLGTNAGIRFEQYTGGNFVAVIGDDNSNYNGFQYMNGTMVTNTWYHIGLVWNTSANLAVGYLNGSQVFSVSHDKWATTMPTVTIGNGFSGARYYQGRFGELQMYSSGLSSTQILQNYNATKSKYGL